MIYWSFLPNFVFLKCIHFRNPSHPDCNQFRLNVPSQTHTVRCNVCEYNRVHTKNRKVKIRSPFQEPFCAKQIKYLATDKFAWKSNSQLFTKFSTPQSRVELVEFKTSQPPFLRTRLLSRSTLFSLGNIIVTEGKEHILCPYNVRCYPHLYSSSLTRRVKKEESRRATKWCIECPQRNRGAGSKQQAENTTKLNAARISGEWWNSFPCCYSMCFASNNCEVFRFLLRDCARCFPFGVQKWDWGGGAAVYKVAGLCSNTDV